MYILFDYEFRKKYKGSRIFFFFLSCLNALFISSHNDSIVNEGG